MRPILLVFLINMLFQHVYSQNDTIEINKIQYTPDFKFKEGIYLSIDQVLSNNPIPKARVITSEKIDDGLFFETILQNDIINLYDNLGTQKQIKTPDIWGFCKMGKIYIQYNGEFNMIPILGSISHFVANKTVVQVNAYDPYYNNNLYYHDRIPTSTSEMIQYILDFSTGKIYEFSTKNLLILLMKDTELYDEFNSLRNKEQRKKIYLYLRKFNERNPLYLTVE